MLWSYRGNSDSCYSETRQPHYVFIVSDERSVHDMYRVVTHVSQTPERRCKEVIVS